MGWLTKARWPGDLLAGLAVVSLCLIGVRETRSITNPVTILATHADRQALDWISKNTPQEARFLINAASWQSNTYRGVDGGYWIMSYTGRQQILPPAVYIWGSIDYITQVNDWAKRVAQLKDCSPEFWSLVQDSKSTYVYVREGAGSLQASALNACQRLKPIYQDRWGLDLSNRSLSALMDYNKSSMISGAGNVLLMVYGNSRL